MKRREEIDRRKPESQQSKRLQQLVAFVFGVTFILGLLWLAVFIPEPTAFQYTVFRVVLALAAAGVGAMIPGFLQFSFPKWLRAGGALAIFAVVYFTNPAALIAREAVADQTAPFAIVTGCMLGASLQIDTYRFPMSDIRKKAKHEDFVNLVSTLPLRCDQTDSTIFRMKDEAILRPNDRIDAVSSNNLGVVVLPNQVIAAMGGNHVAFTRVYAEWAEQRSRSRGAPIY